MSSIGKTSFVNCDSLKNVTIPKNVSLIDANAFGYNLNNDTLTKNDVITITGYRNTAAQDYATMNDIPFIALDPEESSTTTTTDVTVTTTTETIEPGTVYCGDVNLDGKIDLTDSVVLNKATAGTVDLGESARANADCNTDGEINGNDAILLLKFLVHSIDTLPYIEE